MATDEKTTDLFTRLRSVERLTFPERVHGLADRYADEFTDECIQPWEIVSATFDELPPARQEHVLSCAMCSMVMGRDETAVENPAPSPKAVAQTAAVAAARQHAASRPRRIGIFALVATFGAGVIAAVLRLFRRAPLAPKADL